MIKALVLDYGNVISEPQDVGCYGRMAALSGLPEAFFREAFWRYRPDYDRGTIRGREMYLRVLAEAGLASTRTEGELTVLADRLLAEDLGSWFHVSRPVTEWALSLKESGYALGILSNMPFDFIERYGPAIELFGKADVTVFSCYESLIKPEPAIYRALIDKLSLEPEEIAFFDDIEANVAAARAEGLRAFVWKGLAAARKDLAAVTVPSPS
jgi:putative hydrolase of the HAD superfamily